ncbi:phosphotransferase [Phenylobacterium aquaticum]|uniref:phosphotransferase n=1 Tax=Phenylobacterium aquaticum TaxID=1763816 RepID=UPI001F5CE7D9|nr:phosphotransferase [Phenylobacterium aquaticum]MCI3133278.1 phosphotransferase [Phenylobacterium aquaticum]
MSIPEIHRAAVARALTAAFGTDVLDSVTPLSGGLSGALILKIRVGGIAYVLRIEGARDAFRDPHRWYGCMRRAAEACLAPRVWCADPEDGVAVLDFIPERPMSTDYAGTRADLIVELAQTVRILHQTPGFPPLVGYLDAMESLLAPFRAGGIFAKGVLDDLLGRYARLAALYSRLPADEVSSHNDLNPRNLLYDGRRIWLVDWESAFRTDRYVDLAALLNMFTADEAEAALAVRTYFNREPTPQEAARLQLMRQINHVFYGVMFLSGAAAERPGARFADLEAPPLGQLHRGISEGAFALDPWEGRVTYGKAHLAAARDGMAGPAFDQAARVLAA